MSKGIEVPSFEDLRQDLMSIIEIKERVEDLNIVRLKELLLCIREITSGIFKMSYENRKLTGFTANYSFDNLNYCGFDLIKLTYLRDLIQNKIDELIGVSNSDNRKEFYPFKELKNYNLFSVYVNENIIEPYIDFSYLFQRLLHQKLMFSVTQKEFFKWLLKNDFITQKNFNLFNDKGQFYTLKKSTTPARENNFNNLFEL